MLIVEGQNFSNSVDLDWHLSPEGQSVFAHLKDPASGTRRTFGWCTKVDFLFL
jgi:hypothetical protein